MSHRDRTIVLEVGADPQLTDLAGIHTIRFDGGTTSIGNLIDRFRRAGCAVDDTGTDCFDTSRFAGLTAFARTSPD